MRIGATWAASWESFGRGQSDSGEARRRKTRSVLERVYRIGVTGGSDGYEPIDLDRAIHPRMIRWTSGWHRWRGLTSAHGCGRLPTPGYMELFQNVVHVIFYSGRADPQVTRDDLRKAGLLYVGERDPADPKASTLFADPRGLPPLLMQVGGDEVLLDDSRIFAERARAAGVDVSFKVFDGMWHVFQFHAPEVPEAQAAINDIAAFIRAQFGD